MTEMPTQTRSMTAIVAATLNNGIGLNGGLPWRLPNEMKYFARVTTGETLPESSQNAVLMGRKTWDGIPTKFRPLKNRINLVVSRSDLDLSEIPLTSSHKSIPSALDALPPKAHRTFLIGGAQLYSLAFTSTPPLVDRILLTRILSDFECDTYLDDFASHDKKWELASHAELCQWVGFDVQKGEIEEKGTKYRFEMWVWRK